MGPEDMPPRTPNEGSSRRDAPRPAPGARPPTPKRGLVVVLTGDGKGKTTAALGMALRAAGSGFRVKVIQFVKSRGSIGEVAAAKRLAPNLEIAQVGRGFTIEGLRRPDVTWEEHESAAAEGLRLAREALASGGYQMVILDEVLYALRDRLVSLEDVLGLIAARPASVHLVLTGRSAPPEVIDAADLATEMHLLKHHYDAGIPAQRGIEF